MDERRVTVDQETIRKIDQIEGLCERNAETLEEIKRQFVDFKSRMYELTGTHTIEITKLKKDVSAVLKWQEEHVELHKESKNDSTNRWTQTIMAIGIFVSVVLGIFQYLK